MARPSTDQRLVMVMAGAGEAFTVLGYSAHF